jgi:hypothetical protein
VNPYDDSVVVANVPRFVMQHPLVEHMHTTTTTIDIIAIATMTVTPQTIVIVVVDVILVVVSILFHGTFQFLDMLINHNAI